MDNQNQPQTTDDLTDADARAFVASSGLQPDDSEDHEDARPESPPTSEEKVFQAVKQAQKARAAYSKAQPVAVYIAVAVLLALVITAGLVLASNARNDNSTSSGGLLAVPTPNSAGSSGLSNQTQQDIKTCSNVVNAALEC